MKATETLHDRGQSLWLDNITRDLLETGTLARYIAELSVTGLTSNPTIFDHAIKNSRSYDAAIRKKVGEGKSGEDLFFELALEDLTRAADLFRPIWERTRGVDARGDDGVIRQFRHLPGVVQVVVLAISKAAIDHDVAFRVQRIGIDQYGHVPVGPGDPADPLWRKREIFHVMTLGGCHSVLPFGLGHQEPIVLALLPVECGQLRSGEPRLDGSLQSRLTVDPDREGELVDADAEAAAKLVEGT